MLIKGTAHWAKVIGDPRPGFDGTTREWSIDVEVDDEAKAALLEAGVKKSRFKEHDDGFEYIKFRRRELKENGEPNQPIRVVDRQKNPWDNRLIGNGSKVACLIRMNDTRYGLQPYLLGLQVLDLVEYETEWEDFDSYDENGNSEGWED